MIISLVNFTKIRDDEIQLVLRAINRQITYDFEPYWSMGGRLRLEGAVGKRPKPQSPAELRGDVVVYLWDHVDVDDALGYHDQTNRGVPYGFVFTELSRELEEPWSVTLSHEVLELIGDATANVLAAGPHPDPTQHRRTVFHWYEMCDAVQDDTYAVDGVFVSNFVLPLYFTKGEQLGSRNDFLGTSLRSFGVNPGGYIGFFDPLKKRMGDWEADARAQRRMKLKRTAGLARRSVRYRALGKTLRKGK